MAFWRVWTGQPPTNYTLLDEHRKQDRRCPPPSDSASWTSHCIGLHHVECDGKITHTLTHTYTHTHIYTHTHTHAHLHTYTLINTHTHTHTDTHIHTHIHSQRNTHTQIHLSKSMLLDILSPREGWGSGLCEDQNCIPHKKKKKKKKKKPKPLWLYACNPSTRSLRQTDLQGSMVSCWPDRLVKTVSIQFSERFWSKI
jgi:hypothetical protein